MSESIERPRGLHAVPAGDCHLAYSSHRLQRRPSGKSLVSVCRRGGIRVCPEGSRSVCSICLWISSNGFHFEIVPLLFSTHHVWPILAKSCNPLAVSPPDPILPSNSRKPLFRLPIWRAELPASRRRGPAIAMAAEETGSAQGNNDRFLVAEFLPNSKGGLFLQPARSDSAAPTASLGKNTLRSCAELAMLHKPACKAIRTA